MHLLEGIRTVHPPYGRVAWHEHEPRIRQRGGSIPSDNVMKLVPKACPTGAPGFDNTEVVVPGPAARADVKIQKM